MMVMTAKVDMKKILMILGAIALGIILLVMLFRGGDESTTTAAPVTNNDSRVEFLQQQGWEVSASPAESGQVRIPQDASEMFSRYNDLQKSQGYDLTKYAGKTVMRYVYRVNNYPDATEPVYATVLVYKNKIIGGDITNTAPDGTMQGIVKAES
ncbi:MAG: DUF4830 domain-containing protein [Oscillospiraceae bacterium]|nr:DUF4830 domain-containing protein [Oscillospiraceae bacterium]